MYVYVDDKVSQRNEDAWSIHELEMNHLDEMISQQDDLKQRVRGVILQAVSVYLFFLHSSVLKPYFYLTVGEVQHSGKL